MPTLNQYADQDGYYILARPSDTGNITYQLKPRGEQIVEKVGYQDGEEIGWQVISALKVPNLVYTGDEGTTEDDMSVSLDNEEIDALSKEDAKQLLAELSSVTRVGESQIDKIEEILDVGGGVKSDLEGVVSEIEAEVQERGIFDDRPLEDGEEGTLSIGLFTSSEDLRDQNIIIDGHSLEADYVVKILGDITEEFKSESQSDNFGFFDLSIYITAGYGITSLKTEIDTGYMTNDGIITCRSMIDDIIPYAVSNIESLEIGTE